MSRGDDGGAPPPGSLACTGLAATMDTLGLSTPHNSAVVNCGKQLAANVIGLFQSLASSLSVRAGAPQVVWPTDQCT